MLRKGRHECIEDHVNPCWDMGSFSFSFAASTADWPIAHHEKLTREICRSRCVVEMVRLDCLDWSIVEDVRKDTLASGRGACGGQVASALIDN